MMVVMVMMPPMMVMMMVVPMVVMVVIVPRQLHARLRGSAGVGLRLSVERRQNRDGIGNRLQQFGYAGDAQRLIGLL